MNTNQTHVLGSKIDFVQPDQVDQLFLQWEKKSKLHHIVTLNPEIALYAEDKEDYRRHVLNKADLTTRDGFGLAIGAWILGTKCGTRITGGDLTKKIIRLALKSNKSVYLLGGSRGVAKKAAQRLQKHYPTLKIAGAEEGMSKQEYSLTNPQLINRINQSGASFLLVAFGAPKQEQWINANREKLTSIRIAIGVGGIFDYLAGTVPTPPRLFKRLGLEWLFRFFTQRKRFKRILNAVIVFPLTCLKWRLRILFKYRKNVVGVIKNPKDQILLVSPWWSQTTKWQFPQGGVDKGESDEHAILREMHEELGTDKLEINQSWSNAYKYDWPNWYQLLRGYKGQKQSIFSLSFIGENKDIDIEHEGELSKWTWSDRQQVIENLAPSRKSIGKIALDLID